MPTDVHLTLQKLSLEKQQTNEDVFNNCTNKVNLLFAGLMSHTADDLRQYRHFLQASIITLGDGTHLHSSLSPPLAKASAGYLPP
ncbi:MAG: hypothetical protein KAH97_08420, partial [Anaerolineales bacterium]|nr:hypothetical protein [Anaerolineales bacterium]